MKKTIALILALALVFCMLAGCGDKGETPVDTNSPVVSDSNTPSVPDPGKTGISDESLIIVGEGEFSALLPQYLETNPNARGNNLIWDTLVHYNTETGEILPGIATDWEWIDNTHIRFTLREGITFSDGSPLTAADVLYSFEQGKNYNLSGYYNGVFDTDNFVIENDYSIVFALYIPYPQLLDILGCTHYAIICKSAIEAAGGMESAVRTPVSSGKYYLIEWADGQYCKFQRFDDYWDQDDLPYYKYITYLFSGDAAARLMALQSGEAQFCVSNTVAQIPTMDSDSNIEYVIKQQNNLSAVWLNCAESEAMKDARVREAICLALDASAFNAVANNNLATETDACFPLSSPLYYSPANNYREVNLDRAKELLAEAGYPNGEGLTLNLLCSNNRTNTEVLQAMLLKLGINAVVNQVEQATYLTMLRNGEYDINIGMADTWDPVALLNRIDGRVSAATAQGGSRYQDEDLYELIDKAKHELDESARKEIYAEIQQFVCDNYICYPLYNYIRVDSYASSLTGLTYDLRGWPVFSTMRPVS